MHGRDDPEEQIGAERTGGLEAPDRPLPGRRGLRRELVGVDEDPA
jgi:hypothetical protein